VSQVRNKVKEKTIAIMILTMKNYSAQLFQ